MRKTHAPRPTDRQQVGKTRPHATHCPSGRPWAHWRSYCKRYSHAYVDWVTAKNRAVIAQRKAKAARA